MRYPLLLPKYTSGRLRRPDGAEIAYTMVGEGPIPVVVLPGIEDAFATVDTLPSGLACWYGPRTTSQRLLILSRRQPMPADYTPEQHAQDVRWAMEQLRWGPATLECISAGGPIGQWMAINAPELVQRLILSSTLHRMDEHTSRISRSWIALARQGRWGELRWSIVACTFNQHLWLFSPFLPGIGLLGPPAILNDSSTF